MFNLHLEKVDTYLTDEKKEKLKKNENKKTKGKPLKTTKTSIENVIKKPHVNLAKGSENGLYWSIKVSQNYPLSSFLPHRSKANLVLVDNREIIVLKPNRTSTPE